MLKIHTEINADIVDKGLLDIEQEYNSYYIENDKVPSGYKTKTLIRLIEEGKIEKPKYINLSEISGKDLEEVFYRVEQLDIEVFILHNGFHGLEDREYLYFGEVYTTTKELIEAMEQHL